MDDEPCRTRFNLSKGSFFFFSSRRRHTRLQGDWSSDVCSSDLHWPSGERETIKLPEVDRIYTVTEGNGFTGALCGATECEKNRSEERRVGKECRSRWSPYH